MNITKTILKADIAVDKAKQYIMNMHNKTKDNRAAEMVEVAIVIGVVIAAASVFGVLGNSIKSRINEAVKQVNGNH